MKPVPRRRSRDITSSNGSHFWGGTWQVPTHGPFVTPNVKHVTAVPDMIIRFSLISVFPLSHFFFSIWMFSIVYELNCTTEASMRNLIHPVTPMPRSALVCRCSALLWLLVAHNSVLCLEHHRTCTSQSLLDGDIKFHHQAAREKQH